MSTYYPVPKRWIHPRHKNVTAATCEYGKMMKDIVERHGLTACEVLMILSERLADLTRSYVQQERGVHER